MRFYSRRISRCFPPYAKITIKTPNSGHLTNPSKQTFAEIGRNGLNFDSKQKDKEFIIFDEKVRQNEKEGPKNERYATNTLRLPEKNQKKFEKTKSGKIRCLTCCVYISLPGGGLWPGQKVNFWQKSNLFLSVFGIMGKFYR